MKPILLASSGTLDGIRALTIDYLLSPGTHLKEADGRNLWTVYNGNGYLDKYRVIKIGRRFRLERIR